MGAFTGFFAWIFTSTIGKFIGDNAGSWLKTLLGVVDANVQDATKREELKTQLLEAYLQAQVNTAMIRKDAFGKWAWVMAAVFLPGPVLWWTAVFYVSVFPIPGYTVLALPANFYPWMTSIIGALFFIPAAINLTTNKSGGVTGLTAEPPRISLTRNDTTNGNS